MSLIYRSSKGSNLTPSEVDGNFRYLKNQIDALIASSGSGTVTSVSASYSTSSVLKLEVTGTATINPTVVLSVIGSPGYVKSSGSALSVSASIPFSDTTGTVPINRGGTGLTSAGSDGKVLWSNSGALAYATIAAGSAVFTISRNYSTNTMTFDVDQSAMNLNSIGSAALSIAKGGTGQVTASAAINALVPSQAGNAGKVLTTDGSVVSWSTSSGGIGSLNSLTGATQTFSAGTGNGLTITSSGTQHTFQMAAASAVSAGVITTGAQTIPGVKTFAAMPIFTTATASAVAYFGGSSDLSSDSAFNYSGGAMTSPMTRQTKTLVVTADTNMAETYASVLLNHSAAIALRIPDPADCPGQDIVVKDISGSAATHHVNITCVNGTVGIDGDTGGVTLLNNNGSFTFRSVSSDGGSTYTWVIISKYTG